MSIFVKICGITNEKDAYSAIKYGADAIGLNQFTKSPRYVDESELFKIKRVLSREIIVVPVFVNPEDEEVYKFLQILPNSTLQFHGSETHSFCEKFNKPYIKSINVSNISNHENFLRNYESAEQILLDSGTEQLSGGTGEKFDWNQIPTNFNNLIIAGGLNPNNILRLLDYFIPFGVDVCSGVESKKGVKDTTKMKNFIDFVKKYER